MIADQYRKGRFLFEKVLIANRGEIALRIHRIQKRIAISIVVLITLALFPYVSAHAATYTVTNTGDSGPGSLRQAITDAAAGCANIHANANDWFKEFTARHKIHDGKLSAEETEDSIKRSMGDDDIENLVVFNVPNNSVINVSSNFPDIQCNFMLYGPKDHNVTIMASGLDKNPLSIGGYAVRDELGGYGGEFPILDDKKIYTGKKFRYEISGVISVNKNSLNLYNLKKCDRSEDCKLHTYRGKVCGVQQYACLKISGDEKELEPFDPANQTNVTHGCDPKVPKNPMQKMATPQMPSCECIQQQCTKQNNVTEIP